MRTTTATVLGAALLFSGCFVSRGGLGESDGAVGADAGMDAAADGSMGDAGDDGGFDASVDASIDAGPDGTIGDDGGLDAGTDAGLDAGTDAGSDAGTDAGFDAGTDAGFDAGMDAGFDAGMDAGFDAGMDAGFDAGFDAGMDAGFDAGFDAGMDAGFDAGMDAGSDAGTDAGDPWPCGTMPTVPTTVTREFITISNVQIGSGGNTAVLSVGSSYRLRFDWEINDTGCTGCLDQIEIGLSPGNRFTCVYDGNPPFGGASGSFDRTLTVPAASGEIDLRFNLGQNWSCNYMGASTWWGGAPPGSHTFGTICISP